MAIELQFVLGTGFSSRAIAWYSAGHFSHVDAVLPSGALLGARSDRIGSNPPGVQVRQANYEHWKYRVPVRLTTTRAHEKRFIECLYSQLGKPYDTTAIWGFAAGRDWRATDSWFCSELQSYALEQAGVVPELYSPVNKITPAALALMVSAVGGKFLT